MINFANGTVFNLKPIKMNEVNRAALGLLLKEEQPLCAFRTVRDQVLFTNKRIITVDVQGVTEKKQDISTLPYSNLLFFIILTCRYLRDYNGSHTYVPHKYEIQ